MTDQKEAGAEAEVPAKIANFSEKYKPVAQRLHELIIEADPSLVPRLWYGMPGYAKSKDSAVIFFFREDKYLTFGLTENADIQLKADAPSQLIDCAWFLTTLDAATEQRISDIVRSITK